jgi:hypothetical protein
MDMTAKPTSFTGKLPEKAPKIPSKDKFIRVQEICIMQTTKFPRTKLFKSWVVFTFLVGLISLNSCSGGGGGGAGDPASVLNVPEETTWQKTSIRSVNATGLLTANLKVVADSSDRLHVVNYGDSGNDSYPFAIEHSVWDLSFRQLEPLAETQVVVDVDNSSTLDLALGSDGTPVVVYQGGNFRECGAEQSDVMISLAENGNWDEYLGAIGFVHRNPVLTDGLAGADADVVVDSRGDVHVCYQFSYEGCDAMNHNYPDLRYVKRERALLDDEVSIIEETIEGSLFPAFDYGIQNSVGYHCQLVLDAAENPVAFYGVKADQTNFGDQTSGLRVARRDGDGTWQLDWVDQDCEVVALSAARSGGDDTLAVAYAVKENNGVNTVYYLKYAEFQNNLWTVETVDDSVSCGSYCSLAFDSEGRPAIAYYEIRSHTGYTLQNLKFARTIDGIWQTEQVAQSGDIGKYNNLWFDGNDRAHICTYTASQDEIILFQE